jgi:hypothetical protein
MRIRHVHVAGALAPVRNRASKIAWARRLELRDADHVQHPVRQSRMVQGKGGAGDHRHQDHDRSKHHRSTLASRSVALAGPAQRAIAQRFSGVLDMFSSLEVKVLCPT